MIVSIVTHSHMGPGDTSVADEIDFFFFFLIFYSFYVLLICHSLNTVIGSLRFTDTVEV